MKGPRRRAGRWSHGRALAAVLTALTVGACGDPGPGRGEGGAPGEAETPSPEPGAASGALTGFDTVFAYFTGPDERPVPAARAIPDTARALRAAYRALLGGPTAAERDAGLQSWFSDETAGMLASVTLTDGFAVVDFLDFRPVIPNAVSSAGALMLLGELTATAFQFPGVRRVEFRIGGDCEALMAWLQFGCYPITRSGWEAPERFRTAVEGRGGATP